MYLLQVVGHGGIVGGGHGGGGGIMTEAEVMTRAEVMADIINKEMRSFMNQETKDQGWQRIQSRIDLLASQFLKEDYPAIEYKTSIAGLLQLQPEYNEESVRKNIIN